MKTRLLCWVSATVVSALLAISAHSQPLPRIALLIGNANYPAATKPLSTTMVDTRALAEEFRRNNFEVNLKQNLGKHDMQVAIDAFTEKIRSGSVALFYFSGYGIQIAAETYLMPVNAEAWTEAEVRRNGISLAAVLAEMHRRGAKVKIIIIDAARRNPFEDAFRSTPAGLGRLDIQKGTLAIYSSAPGKLINDVPSANSIFTGELIKNLRNPILNVEDVFNRTGIAVSHASNNEQVPWVASSLVEPFYMGSIPAAPTKSVPSPAPQAPSLPLFPWPPPASSASYVLPVMFFEKHSTVGDVANIIISALERNGYVERSFFGTEAGGVALVTRLERINEDGSSSRDPERWPTGPGDPAGRDLIQFFRGLFFVDRGRYRVIVFIMQDLPFSQTTKRINEEDARAWVRTGANALPRDIAGRNFAGLDCTALIYEFASDGDKVRVVDSRLNGKQHLHKAGVLSLLVKSN